MLDAGSAPRPATEGGPDRRSPGARRAGALIDLIRLAAGAGPATSGTLPTTLVLTTTLASLASGHPALAATTESGERIDAATIRGLACDAGVIPAVLGGASEVLDIGRATRTVPIAIRRALVIRDRHCAFPGCDRPPRWCDAHHIQHWVDGGPTSLHNLVLRCNHHHHTAVHAKGWTIHLGDDHRPIFTPPAWLDPTRRPRGPTDP